MRSQISLKFNFKHAFLNINLRDLTFKHVLYNYQKLYQLKNIFFLTSRSSVSIVPFLTMRVCRCTKQTLVWC